VVVIVSFLVFTSAKAHFLLINSITFKFLL
jgi:hypothetical protein